MQERRQSASTSLDSTTSPNPLKPYDLDNVECELCGNRGVIPYINEKGELYSRECVCMKKRRAIRRLKESGLGELARSYTMDAYRADTPYRQKVKEAALRYIDANTGWFFIAGQPGSGKTHICTAICLELLEKDRDFRFMDWRRDGTRLKTGVTERESYEKEFRSFEEAELLYIDDFLKGSVSEADLRLDFDLLNARYNRPSLLTVLSGERSLGEILALDEAIGGRIRERAAGFLIKAPAENYRLTAASRQS